MIAPIDFRYTDIPWKAGGRTRAGVDCAGLAALFLREDMGITLDIPAGAKGGDCAAHLEKFTLNQWTSLERGDLIFFADKKTGRIAHVATHLGGGKLLHIVQGHESRIDNGFKLLSRGSNPMVPCGFVRSKDAERLVAALADPALGDWTTVALIAISLALSAISYAISPKLARQGNKYGRYGFDALVTQNTPEVPLPDLLGAVVMAGNSPYTQQSEKGASATASAQKANKVVILASGPVEDIDYVTGLKINGLGWNDTYFFDSADYQGFAIDPAQTGAEAVTGSVNDATNVPTISRYLGAHATTVPLDVRAQFDREFPLYGFSGCAYLVFRLIDSSKFTNFNVTARVKGRQCRTFNGSGFVTATDGVFVPNSQFGSSLRRKLEADIASVNYVKVSTVTHLPMDATHQSGSVYSINRTKGYIEVLTTPDPAQYLDLLYDYYVNEWTANPASQIVYLLTDPTRGKGFGANLIDWPSAVDFRDHCDELITWPSANGPVTEARYVTNYAVDFRKPVQEHIKALLDASNGMLFLSGGKFVLRAIKSDSSVFSFTQSNILAETFASELLDRTERANRIKLLYHSDEAHNAEVETIADDVADQAAREARSGNDGVVEDNIKFPAITVPSQAERMAETFLRQAVGLRWMVEFTTTVKGLALQKGDVIDVTHSSQPAWGGKLFRIDELDHDASDRLMIKAGEYVPSAFI